MQRSKRGSKTYLLTDQLLCYVQIGLSGKAKLLQQDLNRIAQSADTSGVTGFHRVLQGEYLGDFHGFKYIFCLTYLITNKFHY